MKKLLVLMVMLFTGMAHSQVQSWEDCISFNYQNTEVKKIGGDWKIVEGSHWMFSFGNKENEAKKAHRVIKRYHLGESCFVGRPGPSMKYLLTGTGNAPSGNLLANEDCISFSNQNVNVKWVSSSSSWKIVDGNMWMLDFGNKRDEAYQSLRAIKSHGFNLQCFVGRPNPSFTYWKKAFTPIPLRRADLGAYGFLKIGQHKRLVRWNELIVLRPGDEFLKSNGIPAFNLYYSDKNYGHASASGYKNGLYFNGSLVSKQNNRSMDPGQKKDVWTQAYFRPTPGESVLELRIDDGNSIQEMREDNNIFRVRIKFVGF